MDEKSYLDEYKRTLRSWNQQKPVSRVCLITRIKAEYQSSVMALGNKTQLWDPTGRVYILMRMDKVLTMLFSKIKALGKASQDGTGTGVVLLYPSMLFTALEIPSIYVLELNEILSETMGSEESYVEKPTLICEAHGVERLYDKLLSVVLNIPGPMKMDLDRMRKMWQTSFKNVMSKVYELGRAVSSHQLDRKKDGSSDQRNMTPAQVTDMLQPYTTVGPSPTGSNASYFGTETTNQQTNNDIELGDGDGEDNYCNHHEAWTPETLKMFDQDADNGETARRNQKRRTAVQRIHRDAQLIDETMMMARRTMNLNAAPRESLKAASMKLILPRPPYLELNRHASSHECNSNSTEKSASKVSNSDASVDVKMKRTILGTGDPALVHIPPQRDLVLILNCDQFRPLTDSVRLHTKKMNDSAEDSAAWPLDPIDLRMPKDILRNSENTAGASRNS